MLQFEYFAATESGGEHLNNEDRVMIDGNLLQNGEIYGRTEGRILAAVCDGAGGEEKLGEAAGIAAVSMRCARRGKKYPLSLFDALYTANREVLKSQERYDDLADIKSAIAALYIDEDGYLAFNTGDVRIYSMIDGVLKQLTEDHLTSKGSYLRQKLRGNTASADSFDTVLAKYLGMNASRFHVSIAGDMSKPLFKGLFLVCSDGLYKSMSIDVMGDILSDDTQSIMQKGKLLLGRAKHTTPKKNISLSLVHADH